MRDLSLNLRVVAAFSGTRLIAKIFALYHIFREKLVQAKNNVQIFHTQAFLLPEFTKMSRKPPPTIYYVRQLLFKQTSQVCEMFAARVTTSANYSSRKPYKCVKCLRTSYYS